MPSFQVLPADVYKVIARKLGTQDLISLLKTCSWVRTCISNESIWKEHGKYLDLSEKNSSRQAVMLWTGMMKNTGNALHKFVANIIGTVEFFSLPVLKIAPERDCRDYIDYIKFEEMTSPIMRGVDRARRPFISLRYKKNNDIKAITVFQRYSDSIHPWCNGTCYWDDCFPARLMDSDCLITMKKMLLHEPIEDIQLV